MPIPLDSVGREFGPVEASWTEDDAILYALAVGAEPDELDFVYEKNLRVLPTFAVIPIRHPELSVTDRLGLDYRKLLHGENRIELFRPLPARAKVSAISRVKAIYDKGKGAVVVTEVEARDETGELLFRNTPSIFMRGEGGFGGDRGPSGERNPPPDRPPDATVVMKTGLGQAQLYRLCGDKNILHVDPAFAKLAGFERPILHGLCTYGIVARAAMKAFAGNAPARVRAYEARFAGVVFPGDVLDVEMWKESDERIVIRARVGDRVVVAGAAMELR